MNDLFDLKNEPEVVVVAAMDKNRVIAVNRKLPWSSKDEMNHFLTIVKDGLCVMSPATYKDVPNSFKNTHRIVLLSRRPYNEHDDEIKSAIAQQQVLGIYTNIQDIKKDFYREEEIFICGGTTVYDIAINGVSGDGELIVEPTADRMILSIMDIPRTYNEEDELHYFPGYDVTNWYLAIMDERYDEINRISWEIHYLNRKY